MQLQTTNFNRLPASPSFRLSFFPLLSSSTRIDYFLLLVFKELRKALCPQPASSEFLQVVPLFACLASRKETPPPLKYPARRQPAGFTLLAKKDLHHELFDYTSGQTCTDVIITVNSSIK